MNMIIEATAAAATLLPLDGGTPYCLPVDAQNALATARFWTQLVAVAMAVVALMLVGIGMFFQTRRGDGGQMLQALGWWIGGVVLVAASTGIAGIFLSVSTNCIQR